MKDISRFFKIIDFPEEAQKVFIDIDKALGVSGLYKKIDEFSSVAVNDCDKKRYLEILEEIKGFQDKINVSVYSLHFYFLMCCFEKLEQVYESRGIPKDIFIDTAKDIVYKLYECKKTYGVWGTFVAWWYIGFFQLKIIKLGRLEFETGVVPFDRYEKYGVSLKKGDEAVFCHIPSSGRLFRNSSSRKFKKFLRFG